MRKQTITVTLFSDDNDFKCKNSEMFIEMNIYDDRHISDKLTGLTSESIFSLVKDLVNNGIEEEKKKDDTGNIEHSEE